MPADERLVLGDGALEAVAGDRGRPQDVAQSDVALVVVLGQHHLRFWRHIPLSQRERIQERLVDVVAGERLFGQDAQNRAETQLGCLPHQIQGALLFVHTGKLHKNVASLSGDLRLGDPEAVDAVADDLDGHFEFFRLGGAGGFEHHAGAALQVEAEQGLVAGGQGVGHPGRYDCDYADHISELAAQQSSCKPCDEPCYSLLRNPLRRPGSASPPLQQG